MSPVDPGQLGAWFEAYGARLALYARQWLTAEPAEDAVQEVFVRLMSLKREPDSIKAWLFRSVRNEAISRLRSLQRRKKHEHAQADGRTNWFETHPGDLIDADTLQARLDLLPLPQREVIVLRIWAQMTLQEISEITNQPVSTLHSRYTTGLQALRKAMEPKCQNEPK